MKELNDGGVLSNLRKLYRSHGYLQYHMSKFEEYDLYAKNKDFLISEGVITFNDTDGRLLALKPDVTLSIIKNGSDGEMQKVYYDENVYRVSGSTRSFREIRQLGLECIGEIDNFCILEVLKLSLKTLSSISDNYVLDLSHSGIITAILEDLGLSDEEKAKALTLIAQKNLHELKALVNSDVLISVVKLCGKATDIIPQLEELLAGFNCQEPLSQLKELCLSVYSDKLNIDFSVEGDMSYYNGIVFKGFIEGVPESVLSGGQYDPLLRKMNRRSGAIGFAVYLDSLERLWENVDATAVDVVLLYNERDSIAAVNDTAEKLISEGKRVAVLKSVPKNIRYKQLLKFDECGVASVE